MKNLSPMIPYETEIRTFETKNLKWSVHTIKDLDCAIDQICQLLDPQDPLSEDLSPYFGIIWDSSIGLINYLEEIEYIPLSRKHVEIGAGLALPSFWLASHRADITATDSHPDVHWFCDLNQSMMNIHFPYLAWNWRTDYWPGKEIDVVVGSDILYESRHPNDIINSLKCMMTKNGRLIISDPGRGYLQNFQNSLEKNGFKGKVHIVQGYEKEVFILDYVRTN